MGERMRFIEPQRRRMEARPDRQRNLEATRLKQVMLQIIGAPVGDPRAPTPPTSEQRLSQLELLLEAEPQRDQSGRLRYLLTSGLAVELITGFERFHHDIDFVIMNPDERRRWDLIGTDNVTPGEYWADMEFDGRYLETTARTVKASRRRKSPPVEVVHPGIIMVQKSSDAFGRPPRKRDIDDVAAIVKHWKEREGFTRQWNPIVRHSINALPAHQAQTTLQRVRKVTR